MQKSDVVVVGAGLAGLVAARTLATHGASVVVLEARDRVGGRTFARQVGEREFDLGGQWIGPSQARVARLARELGVSTFPTFAEGKRVLELAGTLTTYTGAIPTGLSMADLLQVKLASGRSEWQRKQVPLARPETAKHAVEWDRLTVEEWKRSHLKTRASRGLFDIAVRSMFGCEARELSVLSFLFFLQSGGGLEALTSVRGGAQQDRFVETAHALSRRMANDLGDRVILSARVHRIAQDKRTVRVDSDAGTFEAARAIVAVPPWLTSRISFEPRLPPKRAELFASSPVGAMVKCVIAYPRPFWRDLGFSGEAITALGPMSVVYDNTSHDRAQPALVALLGGRAAREWSSRPVEDRRAHVLDTIARWFGPEARFCTDFAELDWSLERFSGGCPVGLPTCGAWTAYGSVLREPAQRVHFAGTETAFEWNGYMDGAVESGHRAAHEVLARA